ncbi:hypothetical protein, conserved [Babesia ovata]|uniref:Uncharacterized protein n=1 Tax=Babesia ovata TaxID=189622 RepID=A0A2H6KJ59_9APIC|nr:uncharacterized protein BOVATA_045020 [Babesia ovata]GBE63009.1 hypothetical protein, conserved [Babesia ovata]
MSFLHGVLETVKDDESVKKYDVNVSNKISTLPEKLATTEVSEALQAWSGELEERTDKTQNTFKELRDINIGSIESSLHFLNQCSPENVVTMLENCILDSVKLDNAFVVAEEAYKNLDPKLKDKLKDAVNNIKLQVREFAAAARNDELKGLLEEGERQLGTLETALREECKREINVYKDYLENQFKTQIKERITEINGALKTHISTLLSWIDKANPFVRECLEVVEEILNDLNGNVKNSRNYPKEIRDHARKLKDDAKALYETMQATHRYITYQIETALGAVKYELTDCVKADFAKLRDAIKGTVGMYVSQLGEKVKSQLTTLTKKIADDDAADDDMKQYEGLLDEVENGVGMYAQQFTEGNFERKVGEWIKDILKNYPVKGYIDAYVDTKNGRMNGKTPEMLRDAVEHHIKNELRSEIGAGNINTTAKIQGNVEAVIRGIEAFVAKLEGRFQSPGIGALASSVVTAIVSTTHPNVFNGFPVDTEKYLQPAVQLNLHQLLGVTRQTAKELSSFALKKWSGDNTLASNVTQAIDKVKALAQDLADKLKPDQASGPSTNLGAELQQEVEKQVGDTYGQNGQEVSTNRNGFTTSYDGKDGTVKVTGFLDKAKGSDGLERIKNVHGVNGAITVKTIRDLYVELIRNFDNLIDVIKYKVGETDTKESCLKYKLDRVKCLINNNTDDEQVYGQVGLTKIYTDLSIQRGNLEQLITTAENFITDIIQAEAARTISRLQQFVTEKITKVKKHLQVTAKEEYHYKINKLFTSMKQQVSSNILTIEQTIRQDLNSGVKGLLRKVMDKERKDKVAENMLLKLNEHQNKNANEKFTTLSKNLREYLKPIVNHVENEAMTAVAGKATHPNDESDNVRKTREKLDDLIDHLGREKDRKSYNYDYQFSEKLENLKSQVTSLSPSNFHGFHNPLLLDALKAGMTKFTEQLRHAYVNAYSGKTVTWEETKKPGDTSSETVLSTEGRNCAKVCLTILERVFHDLNDLRKKCIPNTGQWKDDTVFLYDAANTADNLLGAWLNGRGYRVSKKKQDGQLNRKKTGGDIHGLLVSMIHHNRVFRDDDANYDNDGSLRTVHYYLDTYYYVTHLEYHPSPRAPCNIYQMLQWLLGLYYNPICKKLEAHIKTLFDKPNGKNDTRDYKEIPAKELKLSATTTFSAENVTHNLAYVSDLAEKALVAIMGHGHADGVYACDFYTNNANLLYPSNPASCLDMLTDISLRVYHQLEFLFTQCQRTSDTNSWRDCWYGRHIGGSSWTCNSIQCPTQNADQKGNQNHDQMCNQKCGLQVNCGLKSPLQSFLEDGLQGFLPHQFKNPGCKLECTVSNHRGLPCKTPMGFTDISNAASHTKNGAYLRKVLIGVCGRPNTPLALLCAQLTCLLQRTPQTLDDLFSFYYYFLSEWSRDTEHKQTAFNEALTRAYFGQSYADFNANSIWFSSHHSHRTHLKGDLYSLHRCDYEGNSEISCGRYLQPMGMNIWNTFSNKNADKYLSWVVYLTETFYDLLKKLYDDCCEKCDKQGTKCYEKCCDKMCPVKSSYESKQSDSDTKQSQAVTNVHHIKDCKSIANCPFTRPTLAKYGFVFQSSYNLSGNDDVNMRRTCRDFCQTLERALDKTEAKGHALARLIYRTIPNYLWAIRSKFSITLVALWSLSLLYLLHIAVVRLDVLRIRSHLRSPASHRIAAQSLLAAARVKALANVKYFSP